MAATAALQTNSSNNAFKVSKIYVDVKTKEHTYLTSLAGQREAYGGAQCQYHGGSR